MPGGRAVVGGESKVFEGGLSEAAKRSLYERCADALADYFATVFRGMAVRARDGASRAELASVGAHAMRAWTNAGAISGDLAQGGWAQNVKNARVATAFALSILGKTKTELVTVVHDGDDEDWPEGQCFARTMCEMLQDSRAFLRRSPKRAWSASALGSPSSA